MDTRALRLFAAAAESLNITAAGRRLGLAPAVASAKLAKLERELGVELLHRTTRRVALSLDGQEFLPFALEIVAQEDAGRAALGLGASQARGEIRFAAPSSFAQLYVAPLAPEFLAANPGLRLDLRLSDARVDLTEGGFDLALRNAPLDDATFKARKLADDLRILCAAPSYLAARGAPARPEDLGEHDIIAFGERRPRRLRRADGATALFDPSAARLTVDDGLSQKRMTIAGAGVSAAALWSVRDALEDGRLARVLPDYVVDDDAALWLVYPKSTVLSPKVRVLIDFLVDRIGRAPPWLGGDAAVRR